MNIAILRYIIKSAAKGVDELCAFSDDRGADAADGVKDPRRLAGPDSHRPVTIHLGLRVRKPLPPPPSITHSRA